ncbi:MAG: MBL fold metallo-hydrolase [Chloroflexota bacterium]
MVELTFYGGVNEIGGNKILLEDGGRSLLLDFGFPYKRHKQFYEEYLRPRSGAGLLDPLAVGLLPPLEGLYRADLETPELWPPFRGRPHYRRLEAVDGVLLSHAHLDHSGHIAFLREDIPVYATAVTAFIAKAVQDSGRADFDQQVCYYSPTARDCPAGWQQAACLTTGDKRQRRFCLADVDPADLSPAAHLFWERGFWEKTGRQREVISCPLDGHTGSPFKLRCFPVDHSIPGAAAWGIETGAGWVVYSGDLRRHGKRAALTAGFVAAAARLHPRALVLEGTNLARQSNIGEPEVYRNGLRAIAGAGGLVIADFSARDVDRLLTFHRIARDTGRKLAILPKDAYLLKTVGLLEPDIPDPIRDENLVVYQKTTASRSPDIWQRRIFEEMAAKTVLARDIRADPGQFILCFSFFDLNELPSLQPGPGSLYVFSSSEPHDEEQEIDFRRLHRWLEHFGIRGFGLPRESGGEWRIPEDEQGLHASGHACGPDLVAIAREIAPEVLIPVHSEQAYLYREYLKGSGIRVVLPEPEGTVVI